jgi:hypothetical protein
MEIQEIILRTDTTTIKVNGRLMSRELFILFLLVIK